MGKILVTGSNGFIGSWLMSYLQEKGYDVHGSSADIRNIEALRPYFRGIEFVIHAAGKVKEPNNQEDYYTINVQGTKNVAELALENGCKLVHLSSIATEGAYGASKQESQKLVEDFCLKRGLKGIILRLCVIYSKENNTRRRGARYPIEKLMEDIEKIITSHDFSKYELRDYEKLAGVH